MKEDQDLVHHNLGPEQVAALNALQAMRDGRLDTEGGYPAVVDGATIRGYVVIADADDNDGPSLTVYRWRDVLRWYRAALVYLAENPEEATEANFNHAWEEHNDAVPGIVQAMYETAPDDIAM